MQLKTNTRIAALPVGVYPSPIHNGLRLTVRPNVRTWSLRMRHPEHGRLIQQVLGHFPAMGHVDAVGAAVKAREELGKPLPAAIVTIQQVMNHYELTYLRAHRKDPNHRAAQLNRHISNVAGNDASKFSRRDAHALLATLNHIPAAQKTFKIEAQAAFNHAMLTGLIEEKLNPFQGLKTQAVNIRQRVLSEGELKLLLPWMEGADISQDLKDVIVISLHTLARSGECVSIEWFDLDLDRSAWHLPSHKSKNGAGRTIPLHATVVELLRRRKAARGGEGQWVFPSTKKKGHIAQHVLVNALWLCRGKMPIPHFTLHDCRRSGASHLAMMGVPENIIEVGLGHQRQQLVRTYQVYGYVKEVRAALERWGTHLQSLVQGTEQLTT